MKNTDPRVDAHIEKAAGFAKPILRHLRRLVHEACPDAEETLKWSMPAFVYRGQILCGMAAFKGHCTFGFWHQGMTAVLGPEGARFANDLRAWIEVEDGQITGYGQGGGGRGGGISRRAASDAAAPPGRDGGGAQAGIALAPRAGAAGGGGLGDRSPFLGKGSSPG